MTVLVFGTFDILHPGHLDFFKQAKKLGDRLVVVVARDKNVLKIKKHKPTFSEKDRLKMLRALKIVDQAILGEPKFCHAKIIEKIIKKIKPDIVCFGYDQPVVKGLTLKGKTFVHRLKPYYPKIYKSSLYKASPEI